jgi:hypothetical protein
MNFGFILFLLLGIIVGYYVVNHFIVSGGQAA